MGKIPILVSQDLTQRHDSVYMWQKFTNALHNTFKNMDIIDALEDLDDVDSVEHNMSN